MDLQGRGIYRQHRIHTTRLVSGHWVVALVRIGAASEPGRGHTGPPVEHLRGEHSSEAEAIAAARDHIDDQVNDQLDAPPCESADPPTKRAPRPACVLPALGDLFSQQPRGTMGV